MRDDTLLANVLDAHGGLENWKQVETLTVRLALGGPFWAARGGPHAYELTASLDARREHIALAPFSAPDRVAEFSVDPERVTIRTVDGAVVESRDDPRSSFPTFDQERTRWDAIQVAYFQSTSNWNYLVAPFGFTYPGVETRELEPWRESQTDVWRRLAVTFPASNANHNADQVFYYDDDFMLRRMDYAPEVTGDAPIAHYAYDPVTFDGFVFPTRRRVHFRDAAGVADLSFAPITDDVRELRVQRSVPVGLSR
jgi:hypothetical protein